MLLGEVTCPASVDSRPVLVPGRDALKVPLPVGTFIQIA